MIIRNKKQSPAVVYELAEDIAQRVQKIAAAINRQEVVEGKVFFVRSYHSKTRAYARIWGLPRIFQEAAGLSPMYVIEVIAHYFDKLSVRDQNKVLIHELMHIPKTFSGALKSHRGRFHRISDKEVEKIYCQIEDEL